MSYPRFISVNLSQTAPKFFDETISLSRLVISNPDYICFTKSYEELYQKAKNFWEMEFQKLPQERINIDYQRDYTDEEDIRYVVVQNKIDYAINKVATFWSVPKKMIVEDFDTFRAAVSRYEIWQNRLGK